MKLGWGEDEPIITAVEYGSAAFCFDLETWVMTDEEKTKAQLIEELNELRQRVGELEVTEIKHKQAEEALRRLERAMEQSIDGFAVADLNGIIQFVNPAWAKMHDYRVEELLGKNLSIFHTEEQMQEDVNPFNEQVKEKGAHQDEVGHVRKDGTIFSAWMTTTILKDGMGNPTGLMGMARDITEHKQAEEALRESEKLLRKIAENYPHSYISIIESDYTVGFTSGQEFTRQNLDPEQFVGLTLEQVFGDKVATVRPHYEMTFKGEEQSFELFLNNQHQLYRILPLYSEDGSIPRILAVVENITERKQAEEAFQESEKRFRDIFENASIGLYRTTPDGRILMANPALVNMLGYSSFEELAQRDLSRDGFELDHPRSDFLQSIEREGQILGKESTWVTQDGTALFIRESAKAIRDEAGNTLYYEGTIEDITKRKQAEEALRKAHENLSRLRRGL